MTNSPTTIELSTLELFEKYVIIKENGDLDASGMFSLACYQEWLTSRKIFPKKPAEAFRKMITGHLRAECGLLPFKPEIEAAVIKIIKKRSVWDCFKGSEVKIGLRGLRTKGFWEMKDSNLIKMRRTKSESEINLLGTKRKIDQNEQDFGSRQKRRRRNSLPIIETFDDIFEDLQHLFVGDPFDEPEKLSDDEVIDFLKDLF